MERTIELSDEIIARTAGLPFEVLQAFSFEQTVQLVERYLQVEKEIQKISDKLCENLYREVSTFTDDRVRLSVIRLKRQIFNRRMPKKVDLTIALNHLSEKDKEMLIRWQHLFRENEEILQHGLKILQDEWSQCYQTMVEIVLEYPDWGKGLAVASESLSERVVSLLDGKGFNSNRVGRVLQGILLYLTRSTLKVSPFSTFTPLAEATWVNEGLPVQSDFTSTHLKSEIKLNDVIIQGMIAKIERHPDLRQHVVYKIQKPVFITEDGKYGLLERGTQQNEKMLHYGDRLKVLHSRFLDQFYTLVDSDKVYTYHQLAKQLNVQEEESLNKIIDQLVQASVLFPSLQLPELSDDIIRQLAERLRQVPSVDMQQVSTALQHVDTAIKQYEHEDLAGRLLLTKTIKEQIEIANQPLIATVSPMYVYEDVYLTDAQIQLNREAWQDAIQDLKIIHHQIMPLFDHAAFFRYLARELFVKHYGANARVKLIDFYMLMVQHKHLVEKWNPASESKWNPTGNQDLERFYRAQQQVMEEIKSEINRGNWQIEVDLFKHDVPPLIAPELDSLAYLFQLDLARRSMILNSVLPGNGRFQSRFTSVLTGGAKSLRERLHRKKTRLIELAGLWGFNANRHPQLLDEQIMYPWYVSEPDRKSLDLTELHVGLSPKGWFVFFTSSGEPVLPEFLGFMSNRHIPSIFQFILRLTHMEAGFLMTLDDLYPSFDGEEIVGYPRLELGNIVLRRSRWYVSQAQLPITKKGKDRFRDFLAIKEWQLKHGLPSKVFVRSNPMNFLLRTKKGTDQFMRERLYKPQYIDFDSPLYTDLFIMHTRLSEKVMIIEEVYPLPDQSPIKIGEKPIVTEFLMELEGR